MNARNLFIRRPHARFRAKVDAFESPPEPGAEPEPFTPIEFVYFILEKQGITPRALSLKLGYNGLYLNTRLSDRFHAIYNNTAEKLAYLSNTKPDFWLKKEYTPQDAEGISFDMSKEDAVDIAKPLSSGSHLARLRREAAKNPPTFNGLGL